MPTPFNEGPVAPQQYVAYLDLSGGRNTKKDPHALDRNQLAASDNTWQQQGNTIQRRPGNISIPSISAAALGAISAGNVGSGVAAKQMAEGRFFDVTALVVQGADNFLYGVPYTLPTVSTGVPTWSRLGAISGGIIQAAQLFDPDSTNPNGPDGSLFITDGIDTPKYWLGPGNALRPVVTAQLPQKNGLASPITPKYVATLFSSLFYAGEPTDPSMVYISDPFRPQSFTTNILIPTGTITTSTYIGAPVGRGDGHNGGYITGLAPMGSAMIVYKESSIYAMTQLGVLGDMVWGSSCVSSSVGAVSPYSIVPFDTFHVFLGIDGLYTFDGLNTRRISMNNPDLFDGPTAQVLDRTTARAVRYGDKYIIWFDNGAGTGTALGYPCAGAWFDFSKPDADGYPTVGTMSNMNVGGVVPLRGPKDFGNFVWADAVQDRIGLFAGTVSGFTNYSDFGTSNTVTLLGKADFFADVWGDEAPMDEKQVDSVHLLMSFPIVANGQTYTFNGTLYFDQLTTQTSSAVPFALPLPGAAIVGAAIVGTAVVGALGGTPAYQPVPLFQGAPATGTIIQFGFTETGPFPWTSLGYTLLVNRQRRVGTNT